MFEQPLLIIHDVLQSDNFSASQRLHRAKKPFFEWFKETMQLLEGNTNVILLVIASGIDRNPEWVEYIKQHPEWKVECHGWIHEEYPKKTEEEMISDLKKAKKKIEETFGQKVTEFFPPRNKRRGTYDAAEKVGLKVHRRYFNIGNYIRHPYKRPQVDIHYWYNQDLLKIGTLLAYLTVAEPIFIIGAPRSGTTALMRHLGNKTKDSIVLKEVERIWHNDTNIRQYYAALLLRKNGAKVIIDKNVRNSLRLAKIIKLFPHAKFIHLIRDGRAEAASWRKWAIKTNKPDQTIEGAARQWVQYLDAIKKAKKYMKKYEEIRYEDLCCNESYFVSRNFKWKKDLSKEEVKIVEEIEDEWLKELGYI